MIRHEAVQLDVETESGSCRCSQDRNLRGGTGRRRTGRVKSFGPLPGRQAVSTTSRVGLRTEAGRWPAVGFCVTAGATGGGRRD